MPPHMHVFAACFFGKLYVCWVRGDAVTVTLALIVMLKRLLMFIIWFEVHDVCVLRAHTILHNIALQNCGKSVLCAASLAFVQRLLGQHFLLAHVVSPLRRCLFGYCLMQCRNAVHVHKNSVSSDWVQCLVHVYRSLRRVFGRTSRFDCTCSFIIRHQLKNSKSKQTHKVSIRSPGPYVEIFMFRFF